MHLVSSLCDKCVTCCQGEGVTNNAHDLVKGSSLALQQGFPPVVSSDCHAIKSAHVLHMQTPCQLMLPCMLGWQASISLVFQIGINLVHCQLVHHFTSKLFSQSDQKKCYPHQVECAELKNTIETIYRAHLDPQLVADSAWAAPYPSVNPHVSTHLWQLGL